MSRTACLTVDALSSWAGFAAPIGYLLCHLCSQGRHLLCLSRAATTKLHFGHACMHAGRYRVAATDAACNGLKPLLFHICPEVLWIGSTQQFCCQHEQAKTTLKTCMRAFRALLVGALPREDSEEDSDAIPGTAEQQRRLSHGFARGKGMLNPAQLLSNCSQQDPRRSLPFFDVSSASDNDADAVQGRSCSDHRS